MASLGQRVHCLTTQLCLWKLSVILSILPLGRCVTSTGVYGLNAPFAGCPDNWYEVSVHLGFEYLSIRTAISEHLAANIVSPHDHVITMRYCIWNGTENPVPPTPAPFYESSAKEEPDFHDIDEIMFKDFFNFADRKARAVESWPPGKYCIYNVGRYEWNETSYNWDYSRGSCPEGFEPGSSSYPFGTGIAGVTHGISTYSPFVQDTPPNSTSLHFCCSSPGPDKVAGSISLPFVRPFYLLPVGDTDCQKVKNADVRLDWIQWPHLNVESGSHPYVAISEFKNGTKFYMCYYIPNSNRLVASLTYILALGSVVLFISLFLLLGWCNRKRLAWDHSRMLSLQYSGNKNDYV